MKARGSISASFGVFYQGFLLGMFRESFCEAFLRVFRKGFKKIFWESLGTYLVCFLWGLFGNLFKSV